MWINLIWLDSSIWELIILWKHHVKWETLSFHMYFTCPRLPVTTYNNILVFNNWNHGIEVILCQNFRIFTFERHWHYIEFCFSIDCHNTAVKNDKSWYLVHLQGELYNSVHLNWIPTIKNTFIYSRNYYLQCDTCYCSHFNGFWWIFDIFITLIIYDIFSKIQADVRARRCGHLSYV